jgi:hypothetical protein
MKQPNQKQSKHLHTMIQITPERTIMETNELVHCKTKSISFNSTVRVYPSLHVNDYTREEKEACWLSRTEKSHIKSCVRATVQLFYEPFIFSNDDNSEFCTRGLEPMIPQERAIRKQRRKDAVRAVLREQQAQRDDDEHNIDRIADVYKKFTTTSQSVAQTIAKQDEQSVLDEQDKNSHRQQSQEFAVCRKKSRSEALAMSGQGSKRRLTTRGSVVSVQ